MATTAIHSGRVRATTAHTSRGPTKKTTTTKTTTTKTTAKTPAQKTFSELRAEYAAAVAEYYAAKTDCDIADTAYKTVVRRLIDALERKGATLDEYMALSELIDSDKREEGGCEHLRGRLSKAYDSCARAAVTVMGRLTPEMVALLDDAPAHPSVAA